MRLTIHTSRALTMSGFGICLSFVDTERAPFPSRLIPVRRARIPQFRAVTRLMNHKGISATPLKCLDQITVVIVCLFFI